MAEQRKPIIALVGQILAAKSADPDADILGLETQTDSLVNQLYRVSSGVK